MPGGQRGATPSVGEVDDELVAGRFNRGLIDLVGGAGAVIERDPLGDDCIHIFPFG